jgi:hypothetical protein
VVAEEAVAKGLVPVIADRFFLVDPSMARANS